MQAGLSLCWSHIPQCWKSHAWLNYGCIYTIAFWSELSSTPLCLRAAKALVRLCDCPGSPEPLMFSNVISANDSFEEKQTIRTLVMTLTIRTLVNSEHLIACGLFGLKSVIILDHFVKKSSVNSE